MQFNLAAWIMNPFVLMMITVFLGMFFGKIKFGKFTFGVSGCLFVGLVIGWWVYRLASTFSKTESGYKEALELIKNGVIDKSFFTLFLILFIAAVGLLAAKDIGVIIKKYGSKFIILGFLITFTGAAATYGMALILPGINSYEIAGVYTGALTSSPGLAAALESAREHSSQLVENYDSLSERKKQELLKAIDLFEKAKTEDADFLTEEQKKQFIKSAEAGIGIGHSVGYPFGVLIVILAVNFLPAIFKIEVKKEREVFSREMNETRMSSSINRDQDTVRFDLTAFIVTCFLGYTIGRLKFNLGPLGYVALGSTGGVLLTSLILGHIGKIGILRFRMDNKILGVIREISLAFFLAIIGLRYGFYAFTALSGTGIYLVITSLVVGLIAIMVGYLVGRYIFKLNWIMLSGALCGGMTSTPGLGAAIEAVGSDEPAAGYGAIYPFALLGMVIFSIILHNLPI
jgi:putative transport protein